MRRVATADTELGGRADLGRRLRLARLRLGEPRPEAFERRPSSTSSARRTGTSASAGGSTICIGAPLARLELRIALEELLAARRRSRSPARSRVRRGRGSASTGFPSGLVVRPRLVHGSAAGCRSPTCAGAIPARPTCCSSTAAGSTRPTGRRWRRLAAAGWRVTAPDLRGCGESDWDPEARYGVEQTVADSRSSSTTRARAVRARRPFARRGRRVRLRGAAPGAGAAPA